MMDDKRLEFALDDEKLNEDRDIELKNIQTNESESDIIEESVKNTNFDREIEDDIENDGWVFYGAEEESSAQEEVFSSYYVMNMKDSEDDFFSKFPNYFFAGFWMRTWTFIVDISMISAISSIIVNVFRLNNLSDFSLEIFNMTVYALYFFAFNLATNGQTLGKMIFGLRVVEKDGKRLRISTIVTREVFGRLAMRAFPVLYIITAFSPKKQHLFDMLGDTSVISENYLFALRDCKLLSVKE